ncbi:MAG: flippase-like domain-containing protein [Deltaproteobacteria bacterium]|nr:flippase-like domain-containing protein [Deltaproteobacteria bacterium]
MRLFKTVTFLLGVGLLYWMIQRLGVQALLNGFERLGWGFVPVLLLGLVTFLLYTLSWSLFLKRFGDRPISFWSLFQIKVAGEAGNTLTPLNFVGGDPARVWFLSQKMPIEVSGASVVVDRTVQTLAVVAVIVLGDLAALFKLTLPLLANAILGATSFLLVAFVLLFLFYQTRGCFQKILRLLSWLKLHRFKPTSMDRAIEMDRTLALFYQKAKGLFFISFFLHFISRLMGVLEILVLARYLDVPMGGWEALFFAAVIPVTNLLGTFIPGTLGLLEGVVSSLFLSLHWNPADGLVLQMARRLRSFFWIILGFLFILFFRINRQREMRPSNG